MICLQQKIAIIGAGVGGILTLQLLKKKLPNADFILIDDNNFFVFTPRLTEVLSEMVPEKHTVRPTEIFKDRNVEVIISKAKKVDLKQQKIYLENKSKVKYDVIVFAHGARTNFFGLKNAEKNCFKFKDYQDAKKLRSKVLDSVKNINGKNRKLDIALIGGGPTGTELAFALRDLILRHKKEYSAVDISNIAISIFQGSETIVKGQHPWIIEKAQKEAEKFNIGVYTSHRAIGINNSTISFEDGSSAKADIIVWVAGITPNMIEFEPKIQLEKGSIPVKRTLQLKDFENAFAIGDCSLSLDPENRMYPKTAQIASQHAYHASNNIVHLIKNEKLKPFEYKIKGFFLALGNHKTAALAYFLKFNGILGWVLRDQFYKQIFRKLVKGK